jgi:hypothetical protein
MTLVFRSDDGKYEPLRAFTTAVPYDNEGQEIVVPLCKNCQQFKSQLIGKDSFVWVCQSCGSQ